MTITLQYKKRIFKANRLALVALKLDVRRQSYSSFSSGLLNVNVL